MGCAATALLGFRGHMYARLTASATAAIAVIDAWFDITTSSSSRALAQAVACAAAEATPVGGCVFLAVSKWLPGAGAG
ncbi:hypothetical protein ABT186_06635 [Streptomyces sp. NPDC001634]|uniref:hypothetical protein n=1 Tax=Streptomyces sp. NPDC001634 TaxID=3154390 RepID=UPI00331DA2D7